MDEPRIAEKSPCEVELEEGKTYAYCTCGQSANQPFCDGAHAGTDFRPHIFKAEKTKSAWLCRCKCTKNAPFCDGAHKKLP